MGPGQSHTWDLPRDLTAAARARQQITRSCPALPEQLLDAVLLLTSEIVTNAVRHGAGNVSMRLDCGRAGAQVEVCDEDPKPPTLRTPGLTEGGGRGLSVVDAVADAWGTRRTVTGKAVWFRINAASSAGDPAPG